MKLPPWSLDLEAAFSDQLGIRVAILSLSAPGVSVAGSPEQARELARQANLHAAGIRDARPDRYGFFATLPLHNAVADGLEELCYALDALKADGVTLFTSYGGKYLGHEDFRPLWQELNRRQAVVFIHPSSPENPGTASPAVPPPIIDFPHETTRAAVHLITSNMVRDHPDCRIILSHGGGTLPYVATRIAHAAADAGLLSKTADEFLEDARSFYFDLALTGFKDQMQLLSSFAAAEHILWGSDYPFAREKTAKTQSDNLGSAGLSPDALQAITHGAALKLFPRLREFFTE